METRWTLLAEAQRMCLSEIRFLKVEVPRNSSNLISIQEVVCTYVFGAGEEATPKNMRRKGYWLINNPDYILVHYLEVVPKKKAQENTSDTLARASEILKQAMRNNLEETKERAHQSYTLSPSTWNMPIEPLSPIQEDVQQTRCYEFGVHHEI